MKIYIYKIYFPTSDRLSPYYVGQTAYLERRMSEYLVNKSLIGNALRKYNDWQIEILHTCKSRDEANRTEIEEIKHYNSVAPNGYNLTRGGEGGDTFSGKHHTEEAKEKLRKAHKGKQYRKGKTGYRFTKEHSKNMGKSLIGNKRGEGNKGKLKSEEWKRNKSEEMKGKKHPWQNGEKNCSHRTDVKIKRLKTRIKKYEQELKDVS